jgi:hypothetical protein
MTRQTHYDAPAKTSEAYDRNARMRTPGVGRSSRHSHFAGTFIPEKYTSMIRLDSLEFKQLGRRIDSFRMQVWIESASNDKFTIFCLHVRSFHFWLGRPERHRCLRGTE